jgi:tetratricopeptide (TPR) repeat protein
MKKKAVDIVSSFAGDLSYSVSAASLASAIEAGYVPPAIDTPRKGMAKALFDISNILISAFAFTNDLYVMYVGMSLELWPEFEIARVMQAEVFKRYGRTGQYAETLGMIPKSSYLYPINRINYASYLIARGSDDGKALEIYKELLASYPDMYALYQNIGDYYRIRGEYGKAEGYYADGLAHADDKGKAGLYFSRAITRDLSHDIAGAVEDFERAYELDTKNPVLLNYYGYFLLLEGRDVETGRRLVERAVRLEPLNPYYIDSYAWALFKSGSIEEAMKMAEYAKAFEPKNPVIMDHLGDIYWSSGRRREAVFEWSKAKARLKEGDVPEELNGLGEHKLDRKIARGLEAEPED